MCTFYTHCLLIGHYIKARMGAEKPRFAVTSGPALVPDYLSARTLDDVRAESVLVQAGALTLPIPGKTTFGRIESDPIVYVHEEGVEDVSESVPTFAPVEVSPQTLVCLVPLSMEVVQDSPNLDMMVRTSIAAAMALKVDELGLSTILADAYIPRSITGENVGSWPGVLSAVKSALALDQRLPSAHISHSDDFMTRNSELSANYGWLEKPRLLENMAEVYSTAMTAGLGIFGDFSTFAIAVRSELQIELIRYAKSKSVTHLLVCHLRAKGVVLQPKRLYVQDTTTSGI